jgi:hypothetical protein
MTISFLNPVLRTIAGSLFAGKPNLPSATQARRYDVISKVFRSLNFFGGVAWYITHLAVIQGYLEEKTILGYYRSFFAPF